MTVIRSARVGKQRLHLWPEAPIRRDGVLEIRARLEGGRPQPFDLVFGLPPEEEAGVTRSADPFVVAATFTTLRSGRDLEVHGPVSPTLLRGLESFQAAWSRWRPDRYRPFEVHADEDRESVPHPAASSVLTFSGGLYSCYTAWRHTQGGAGRGACALDAAVMVHGFDIPLDRAEAFERASQRARRILDGVGVRLVTLSSIVRDLGDDWEDAHGAALAACLHVLSGRYATGLIASSHTYEALRFPWGSNPLTDPMLGSGALAIVHDGADRRRLEQARAISGWQAALDGLRVCWEHEPFDTNCGACMRCVGTALCFLAEGLPIPPGLEIPSADVAARRFCELKPGPVQELLAAARGNGLDEAWMDVVGRHLRRRVWHARWRLLTLREPRRRRSRRAARPSAEGSDA